METLKLILFLAVLGTLGSGGVLFLWGGGDGRFSDEGAITVEAPNDRVFQWLLYPENRTRWIEGIEESKREGVGRWAEGTRLKETLARDGRRLERTLTLVEVTEGKSLVLETEEEGVAIRYAFTLGAHNTGRASRVLYTVEAVYEGFWPKLFEPLNGGKLYKRTRRELERLASLDLLR